MNMYLSATGDLSRWKNILEYNTFSSVFYICMYVGIFLLMLFTGYQRILTQATELMKLISTTSNFKFMYSGYCNKTQIDSPLVCIKIFTPINECCNVIFQQMFIWIFSGSLNTSRGRLTKHFFHKHAIFEWLCSQPFAYNNYVKPYLWTLKKYINNGNILFEYIMST